MSNETSDPASLPPLPPAITTRKFGRPVSYRPEFCDRVIECGSKGYSLAEMATDIGVTRKTLYEWEDTYPDFCDAMQHAREASLTWWENQARNGLVSTKDFNFNANLWHKCMIGRFPKDYRDQIKHEFTGPGGGPVAVEQHVTQRPVMTREEWIAAHVKTDE